MGRRQSASGVTLRGVDANPRIYAGVVDLLRPSWEPDRPTRFLQIILDVRARAGWRRG